MVEREGLTDRFVIDSCGTGGGNPDWYFTEDPRRGWSYHEGDPAGDFQAQQICAPRLTPLNIHKQEWSPNDATCM